MSSTGSTFGIGSGAKKNGFPSSGCFISGIFSLIEPVNIDVGMERPILPCPPQVAPATYVALKNAHRPLGRNDVGAARERIDELLRRPIGLGWALLRPFPVQTGVDFHEPLLEAGGSLL